MTKFTGRYAVRFNEGGVTEVTFFRPLELNETKRPTRAVNETLQRRGEIIFAARDELDAYAFATRWLKKRTRT